ncbi:MAG: hypothetical protein ACOY4K_00655 [Pseudomonadota bacterium]
MSTQDRISRDLDGSLDEIVFTGAVHLERMTDGSFWMSLTRPDGSGYVVSLYAAARRQIVATCEEEPG